ncbi:MAG TPA: carbamate kinase [Longimicrobiaceae bacterium]|nr:carbamate kinase [Longimicrobiaceae bacterium]
MIAASETGERGDARRGIVIALGGNALSPAGEEGTIAEQFQHTRESVTEIVALAKAGWRIALVHGNGPQVGNALIRNEMARDKVPPLPLGVLVAATEGWIGYMVQQSLQNALAVEGVDRAVVTLVTQVLVDPSDPTLADPSKPIGRKMDEITAHRLARELGWQIASVNGGWRRVVPSPRPVEIVERAMISALVDAGHLVIAAGGGGTPVFRNDDGSLEGLNAVIDKDRAAAVLALDIGAEVLLILTDVDAVYSGFDTPEQRRLTRLSVAEAEQLVKSGELGAGSMGPKVEAAAHFVRHGGARAVIARLDQASEAVDGRAGTEIVA